MTHDERAKDLMDLATLYELQRLQRLVEHYQSKERASQIQTKESKGEQMTALGHLRELLSRPCPYDDYDDCWYCGEPLDRHAPKCEWNSADSFAKGLDNLGAESGIPKTLIENTSIEHGGYKHYEVKDVKPR